MELSLWTWEGRIAPAEGSFCDCYELKVNFVCSIWRRLITCSEDDYCTLFLPEPALKEYIKYRLNVVALLLHSVHYTSFWGIMIRFLCVCWSSHQNSNNLSYMGRAVLQCIARTFCVGFVSIWAIEIMCIWPEYSNQTNINKNVGKYYFCFGNWGYLQQQ